MAFPLSDLRRTVRRNRDDGSAQLYPRLLRGSKDLPRIAVAIRYFEEQVGRRRGEMEPAALVEFFGDPRLARCIVACLTRSYHYRVRTIAEVVGEVAAARLAADGIADARALRLRLFEHANALHHGFIPPHRRAELLTPLLERWGVRLDQLDALLTLDAEEFRVLERITRAAPYPVDVAALYNYHTLDTALRASSRVALDAVTLERAAVKRFAALLKRHGVAGRIERHGRGARFVLYGRQDALGSWTRHGGRLVRVLVRLVGAHEFDGGVATVELKGRPHLMRLDAEMLEMLGARGPAETAEAEADPLDRGLETELRHELSALRRQGVGQGWTVRSDPEPVILDGYVFLPDLALVNRGRRVLLAFATTPTAARSLAETLPAVAGKAPVVVLADAAVRDLLGQPGVACLTFEERLPVVELLALAGSNVALCAAADPSARCA